MINDSILNVDKQLHYDDLNGIWKYEKKVVILQAFWDKKTKNINIWYIFITI